MNAFFLVIDAAGVIDCVSKGALDAFGYSVAELTGQPLARVLNVASDGESTAPPLWLNASQAPVLQGVHRSGRRFDVRLTQHEIRIAGGTHHVLHLQDPTAPATPEVASKQQELYELATQQGRISIWEVNLRTNRLDFSPVLARMLGLTEAQTPRDIDGWKALFYPEDWDTLQRQTERVLCRELTEINTECRMYHVDGSTLWTVVRGKALFDGDTPIKTFGTSIDITDRKKLALERDLLFTMSLDLLCIAGTNGYFLRVNPAFSKTLGYTAEELTSCPFVEFVHPEDRATTQAALAKLARGEDLIAFENRYGCKDGSWRWLSWNCPAVLRGSETVYAVARDVTEAKRVAAELEEAVLEAEKANRAKSEFLSRMSHELRTPLNAILGFGQLLQREPLTSRQSQQIEMIVKGGRHLLNLINEVLDIARIEAGRLDLSPDAVRLSEVLQEVVNLAQPMAEQRAVSIHIDQASVEQQCVRADKQRLKQVLLNLLSNAIKYNREHGGVILRGMTAGTARFRIVVQDTGPGIAPDKLQRLFTPFDRLGAESSGVEGSGLGLVLSKRLVEVMGGTLTYEAGEGATFVVELMQQQCHPFAAAPLLNAAPPATVAVPSRTLLYVEDNLANVKLIEALLMYRPGIKLVTAMQGGLGYELAYQHRPDLVLLDVHLPDMPGSELLAKLRADPHLCHIPIVVISADATTTQMRRLMDGGAKEYVTKPIDVAHFLGVLDRYLQSPGGNSADS